MCFGPLLFNIFANNAEEKLVSKDQRGSVDQEDDVSLSSFAADPE